MNTEFTTNRDAFDRIMGDLATPMAELTEDDVWEQARLCGERGDDVSDTMINAALCGLREYQQDESEEGPIAPRHECESVTTADGHGAYCAICGETLA